MPRLRQQEVKQHEADLDDWRYEEDSCGDLYHELPWTIAEDEVEMWRDRQSLDSSVMTDRGVIVRGNASRKSGGLNPCRRRFDSCSSAQ
jgi:hypothetical protein